MSEMQEWYASGRDRVDPLPPRWKKPDWFVAALRVARGGPPTQKDGLARHLKVVPQRFVSEDGTSVSCHCDIDVSLVEQEFVQCPNGCRWFYSDSGVVWAARLPDGT